MGHLLTEEHGMLCASGGPVGIMILPELGLHPFGSSPAVYPLPVMALHSHLFGNLLENFLVAVPTAKLLLGFPPCSSW